MRVYATRALLPNVDLWSQPHMYLIVTDPGSAIERADSDTPTARVARPARCAILSTTDEARFTDNALDRSPDDPQ